jgi:hypothetical protein
MESQREDRCPFQAWKEMASPVENGLAGCRQKTAREKTEENAADEWAEMGGGGNEGRRMERRCQRPAVWAVASGEGGSPAVETAIMRPSSLHPL